MRILPLIVGLIIFPLFSQVAHGCGGGFFDPYPRTILTAPAESGSPEQVRLLSNQGRDWRIPTPAESGPGLTGLTPEAKHSLVDFLGGGAEHLSPLVPDEMYDRIRPDLWLLRSPEHDGQYKELYVTFNYNHGKRQDDSLVFFQKFNAFDQNLLFSYSVPLPGYPIPPETLARMIRDTEAAFEQWIARFCALNEIDDPRISWQ